MIALPKVKRRRQDRPELLTILERIWNVFQGGQTSQPSSSNHFQELFNIRLQEATYSLGHSFSQIKRFTLTRLHSQLFFIKKNEWFGIIIHWMLMKKKWKTQSEVRARLNRRGPGGVAECDRDYKARPRPSICLRDAYRWMSRQATQTDITPLSRMIVSDCRCRSRHFLFIFFFEGKKLQSLRQCFRYFFRKKIIHSN